MKKLSSKSLAAKMALAVAVAAVIMMGCSTNPTGSQDQPRLLTRAARVGTPGALSPINLYAEKVIPTATGGVLSLLDVTLTVPAGAVPNDTLFSIGIPDDSVFFNEFGTNGLVFDKPVTVTMSYRNADLSGVNVSSIRLAWLDSRDGQWKDMACTVDHVNQTVTGQLNHFSAYGLISD